MHICSDDEGDHWSDRAAAAGHQRQGFRHLQVYKQLPEYKYLDGHGGQQVLVCGLECYFITVSVKGSLEKRA